ncbi:MAG: ATP-binding protein [Bacteroidetes bacterium]|nr:ATP-binding protein [Bacteroidota bacterium]
MAFSELQSDELLRSDIILEAINGAAELLLNPLNWEGNVPKSLGLLGKSVQASRVYVFQNKQEQSGKLSTSQIYEWVTEGVEPQADNPDLQNLVLADSGYERWVEKLNNGEDIVGLVKDFPEQERELLDSQGILSILIVPVFVQGTWWGFVGFDECVRVRQWSHMERSTLRTAAKIIGEAIDKRKVEAELFLSNSQLEATLQSTVDGILVIDLNRMITSYNQRFLDLFDVPPELLADRDGRKAILFILEKLKDPDTFSRKTEQLYDQPHTDSFDLVEFLDGRIFERYSHPLWIDLKPVGRVWNFRDITLQRRSEQELMLNNMLLSSIAKTQSYAISEVEPHELFNDILNELLTITASEFGLIGEVLGFEDGSPFLRVHAISTNTWSDLIINRFKDDGGKWIDFKGIDSFFAGVISKGEPVIFNHSDVEKIMKIIPAEHPPMDACLCLPIYSGREMTGMIGLANRPGGYNEHVIDFLEPLTASCGSLINSMRNETKRKLAVESLIDREFWLIESQKVARIGTYYFDIIQDTWRSTEVLDDLFGIEAGAEKSLLSWINIIHPDHREEMSRYFLNHVVGKRKHFDKEYKIIRQNDREVRWMYGRGDLKFDENRAPVALYGTIQDITGRKQMEEEITIAKEKAEESSRLKTSLLLNISHELRTPMNGILGFAEILKEGMEDTWAQSKADAILISGNRLMATLNSIVDLSQVQADHKKIILKKCNVGWTVRNSIINFADIAETKNLKLEEFIDPDTWAVIDEALLANICHHLLDNALKFTEKGTVSVFVDNTVSDGMEWVEVRIKDTGIGIAPENQAIIFEEFRQVSEGMGRSYEGTGLGLTLCRKFIGLLNGEITLESKLGVGSIFTVRLPVYNEQAEKGKPSLDKPEISALKGAAIIDEKEKPVVLLVEDQDYNLDLMEIYLEPVCRTDRAMDGMTAIKLAFTTRYDAILMDINLGPGMDGLQAAKEIFSIKGNENIPVIAVTGYSTSVEKEHILKNGCTHYIAKPFTRQNLLEVVAEAVKK